MLLTRLEAAWEVSMRANVKLFRVGVRLVGLAAALLLARLFAAETATASASREPIALDEAKPGNRVVTCEHLVPHVSTVPANSGEVVYLSVRERVRSAD